MIKIQFNSVGQGDSIIVEWEYLGKKRVAIIDCNVINGRNPSLEYLQANSIESIEFIILTHFHLDHFSGMSEIFEYCIDKKIRVKCFYHSLDPLVGEIYDKINTSKKIEKAVKLFFEQYEIFDSYVEDKVQINSHLKDIVLFEKATMIFLSPQGRVYDIMAKQLSRKKNRIVSTIADINKLSPIILFKKDNQGILLCSDAPRSSFKDLKNISLPEIILTQVPHHGSWKNVFESFWITLNKIKYCPAVFSVGEEPKDKLPDFSTVNFFDSQLYSIYSTDTVYGIREFLKLPKPKEETIKKRRALDEFSKKRSITKKETPIPNQYIGNQLFSFWDI